MRMGFKSALFAGVVTAVAMASGSASAELVAGIEFGVGANLKTTTIWENTVSLPGDILDGVGRVTAIDAASCGGICWSHGDNGKELTLDFSYLLEKIVVVAPGLATAYFSGGIINMYSDTVGDQDVSSGQATAFATSVNGTPWLNLVGAGGIPVTCDAACFSGAAAVVTLFSTFFFVGDLAAVSSGTGVGFLDVDMGGLGAANFSFDTNTFPSGQDIDLGTTFSKDTSGSSFPLSGSASLKAFAVPEPGSLVLLGSALLGWAGFRRRRAKA